MARPVDDLDSIRGALSPLAWNFLGKLCSQMQVPGDDVEAAYELRKLVRRIVNEPGFKERVQEQLKAEASAPPA